MGKIITAIVVIVVVGAGAWWYMSMNNSSNASMPNMPADQTSDQTGMAPMQTASGNTAAQGAAGATLAPTQSSTNANVGDTSDASMQQDAASIDTQMGGLNSDNASADNGLNSQ